MNSHRTATLALLAISLSAPLRAQQAAATAPPITTLVPAVATMGSLRGEVHYTDGTPVAAADITLTPASGPALHATTGSDGIYAFSGVPSGAFALTASANAFQPDSLAGSVPANAELQNKPLTLRLAAVISVNAISQEQAAEIEVASEEHQRILGAIPNFLVTYDGDPVPLSTTQKYRLTLRTLLDPANFAVSAGVAGGEEATGSYPGFGHGAAGYGRRFGASFGDGASNILLTDALLPSLLHQDPRYFYKGTGSIPSRLGYVLKQAFEQRSDSGHWQPAWSNTLGDVGSALISNSYYPHQNTNWGAFTGQNVGIAILSQGIGNLLQEFVFGHLTTHHSN